MSVRGDAVTYLCSVLKAGQETSIRDGREALDGRNAPAFAVRKAEKCIQMLLIMKGSSDRSEDPSGDSHASHTRLRVGNLGGAIESRFLILIKGGFDRNGLLWSDRKAGEAPCPGSPSGGNEPTSLPSLSPCHRAQGKEGVRVSSS